MLGFSARSSRACALAFGATFYCACSGSTSADSGRPDGGPDALVCRELSTHPELLLLPDDDLVDWVGYVDGAGSLPLTSHSGFVTAGTLGPTGLFNRVWYIDRAEDAGGSLNWAGSSVAGALIRQASLADVHQYLLWRPSLASEFAVEIPIITRWPYGGLGACGVESAQLVPSVNRLWFFRSTRCLDDPEAGTEVLGRLHGFNTAGGDVTPSEGIPLLGEVFWNTTLAATMRAHLGDSVSYLIADDLGGAAEPELHWERRDATGELVARSRPLATAAEVLGPGRTPRVWTSVSDDDSVLLSAELATGPRAVMFARIEPDGGVAWQHRFSGVVANTATNLSRVQPLEGGVVALVSASDGSRRSIIRIAADGTVVHAPREFAMGSPIDLGADRAFSSALAADEWGFTVAVAVGSDAVPVRVTRYDWTGFQRYETPFADTRSTDVLLLARPDTMGGAYVLLLGTRRTSYQHVDAFGRLAGYRRTMSCPSGLNVEENIFYDREPLDGGVADGGPGDIDGGVR